MAEPLHHPDGVISFTIPLRREAVLSALGRGPPELLRQLDVLVRRESHMHGRLRTEIWLTDQRHRDLVSAEKPERRTAASHRTPGALAETFVESRLAPWRRTGLSEARARLRITDPGRENQPEQCFPEHPPE